MQIINMTQVNKTQIMQAAQISTDSLPIGWGGILAPVYNGNVFELHPLAVRSNHRNQGIGRAIVTALEDEARNQGGLTIYLGADDEIGDGETSFANVDLFDNLPGKTNDFTAGTHQSGFYLKLGYKIIGVMPNANGIGKLDIYFGKGLR
ncbi:GNAT family N-acetyltransferase [Alkaliphilus sp. B6464]|uniref:GNAT family N-acetyltransferase n=1 Tax=Alkaliphilus sp. B6464 TaxID=2731219 RepID=UPI001BAD184B|nr:GNAT family N-acetyltransferase [Alkaliphilus sp. B6464]QUH20582.1 GNAT family N-acetyltransferase [Alkaliphilus sp. B6464]